MVKLFFSYSHEDEALRDAIDKHLVMLKREGLIEAIHDRRIVAGESLDETIDAYLNAADVILCLLSPDFIASEYCYSREMERALERHHRGEAQVIPVVLRHCEWRKTPLKVLRATPRDGTPVKAWADLDEALLDVTTDIRQAVESRLGERQIKTPQEMDTTTATEVAETRLPRSSNLHISKALTDRERDDYIEHTFDFIFEFFANSIDELQNRHSHLSGKMSRLDARRFAGAIYQNGRKVSAITVYMGGGWGHGRTISYNNSDHGDTNSANGSFDLSDHSENLRFDAILNWHSSERNTMNYEEVAEAIWASFVEPLQN